jgi:hypothetical protein
LQTSIAQAGAITIFGNDWLRGVSRAEFWPSSTVFSFCKSVRFVSLDGDTSVLTETPFADDPVEWLSKLRSAGTIGLRLHYRERNNPLQDRATVGFVGGGGRWLIESLRAGLSDLWEARWLVNDANDPDRRVWDVSYGRIDKDGPPLPFSTPDLVTLKSELEGVLSEIHTFATRQDLGSFAGAFRSAKEALNSDIPLSASYHSDIAPSSQMPLEAKQLLGAAQAAWVFGGMGSWNDMSFEEPDQQEYVEVSGKLFSLLNQVICRAVNSSA